MKIIADENIPQAREAFNSFGDVDFLGGREITNEVLKDADILLVRSITKVNESLLKGTKVKFVATATAGTDHVDKKYLSNNGIAFAAAAGCNSFSVAEYFTSAVSRIFITNNYSFEGKTLGVVGIGNVGCKVVRFGKILGFKVLMNDPPLERKFGSQEFVPIDRILDCDVITLHVPLYKTGIDKTFHLIDEERLNRIKSGTVFINSSRGAVVDNAALKKRLESGNDLITILDVWENEPVLDSELLQKVNFGSAHIAGYSMEGKVNGTEIIYNRLCAFLNIPPVWKPNYPGIAKQEIIIDKKKSFEELLDEIISQIYDISDDDNLLREGIEMEKEKQSNYFDLLRKNYRVRREFNNYTIRLNFLDEELKRQLEALRFKVI
jgi:erythronate-4-phosphate dehydrogenase